MIKAFIFDLDGVLVDTAKYHALAWSAIAQKQGWYFDHELNESLKGVSRRRSLDIIMEANNQKINDIDSNLILSEKNEIYLQYILSLDKNALLPGAVEVLSWCKQQGLYVCLGSASKNAQRILQQTAILPYFDIIVDGNDVSKAKPDPEVFLLSCARLNITPETCVVFEDSIAGIQAAKTANMHTVGIGDKHILLQADIVIPDLQHFDFTYFHN